VFTELALDLVQLCVHLLQGEVRSILLLVFNHLEILFLLLLLLLLRCQACSVPLPSLCVDQIVF
jgi:hypothetical protein